MNHKIRFRLKLFLLLMTMVLTILTGRLFYWQILCHDELAEAAVSQYQIQLEGMDTRGRILDRSLVPLTGGKRQYWYFLKTSVLDSHGRFLLHQIGAECVDAEQNSPSVCTVYRTDVLDETVTAQLRQNYGAYVLSAVPRYSSNQTACHLIGYLNLSENRGVSGLEQRYEDILQPNGGSLALWADGCGTLLQNEAPKLANRRQMRQHQLVTTLDSGLQKFCETIFAEQNLEGAVLVSEAESGEILAWVSSPVFDPNCIDAYLAGSGNHLVNKCIQGVYPPGSVFKIVAAAAALETNLVDPGEIYECCGWTEVGGVKLGCRAGPEGGHGEVNMQEAMAVSCNCYFAHLGERLGADIILEMAARMGFGVQVLDGFAEESAGFLPDARNLGPQDISNLSIGQGALLVTPMQMHQMMSAAACSGIMHPLTVIKDGTEKSSGTRILPQAAAVQLNEMLCKVMEHGTGSGWSWQEGTAGKTGTAEAYQDGQPVNQCWFSGFFPTEEACFTVTVLVERGSSGSASALPVFRSIYEYLLDRNL